MITTETIKTFLEVLKLAPRYLISLGIMAAALLFPSRQFLERIGVAEFAQNNRTVLGLTLVVTCSLFTISIAADLINIVKKWWKRRAFSRRIADRLHCLTEDEKQILRFYIVNDTRANTLSIEDGVVQGLKTAGIIYQSASLGNVLEGFAHNINEFAWDYLHTHLYLLEGTTNTNRTDKRDDYW